MCFLTIFFASIYILSNSRKLDVFLSADYIRRSSKLPMEKFEAEVWNIVGQKCDYVKNSERPRVYVILHTMSWQIFFYFIL